MAPYSAEQSPVRTSSGGNPGRRIEPVSSGRLRQASILGWDQVPRLRGRDAGHSDGSGYGYRAGGGVPGHHDGAEVPGRQSLSETVAPKQRKCACGAEVIFEQRKCSLCQQRSDRRRNFAPEVKERVETRYERPGYWNRDDLSEENELSGRHPKHVYVHQYGPLLVKVESVSGSYYATVKRLSDGYEATVEGVGTSSPLQAARGAISALYNSFDTRTPATPYEKNLKRIADELGPDLEEAHEEMEATSEYESNQGHEFRRDDVVDLPDIGQGHELGKKKKSSDSKRDDIRKILKNSTYIEEVAYGMYDRGERVSITNVYHTVKGKLGLPGAYDFDLEIGRAHV